ncbi:hypothetical protein H257_07504 [Aphanomyces astaci]|nr:hypothetical protein H257_07504 [Aphanomyces astaci]ETV79512.1 hypothetical protein H257_07504 [Aphanomyces astaci]|eukprot:XP_009831353.1 hypothetical protein H257_07504 [Aphanomyces astaci]
MALDGSTMVKVPPGDDGGGTVAATSMRKMLLTKQQFQHNGNNPSIVDTTLLAGGSTPWTPKSLGRAKSAIVYRQTLNDNLMFLERNIFFFQEWRTRFVSLQDDHILIYSTREKWEQGVAPDRVIRLNPMMLLSALRVDVQDESYDVDGPVVTRLFRRKLLETDPLDQWLNGELRQGLVVNSRGSNTDTTVANNPDASARVIVEFATTNQHTFELWSKCLRRALQHQVKHQQHGNSDENDNQDASVSRTRASALSSSSSPPPSSSSTWVSPGQDSRVTLHQSEIWCSRLLQDDKDKAESELRRIIAMEKLVAQVTGPAMALLVYEKVSRVHELFAANSRREIESKQFILPVQGDSEPAVALSADVLHFFRDHLKRKYAVFLMLALAYGISEDSIREAHERMCSENDAVDAGVGGGDGSEDPRDGHDLGFRDTPSVDLYNKYRTAAANYYKMNFGDPSAAEEEDAIMHLPVMLHVAIVRRDEDEVRAMAHILDTVKERLYDHIEDGTAGNNEENTQGS